MCKPKNRESQKRAAPGTRVSPRTKGKGDALILALIKNLVRPDGQIRRAAACALEGHGPNSARGLEKALSDPDAEVRLEAVPILARIGRAQRPAFCRGSLSGSREDPQGPRFRDSICRHRWADGYGPAKPAKAAIPALLGALGDTDAASD